MVRQPVLLDTQNLEERIAREREALEGSAERLSASPLWAWTKRGLGAAPSHFVWNRILTNKWVWSGAFWLLRKSIHRFSRR